MLRQRPPERDQRRQSLWPTSSHASSPNSWPDTNTNFCPAISKPLRLSRPSRSMAYRLHKLGQYLRGWLGYFGISQYYRPIPELDEWIRRRIRMCYWKQWRWARTKIKNLLAGRREPEVSDPARCQQQKLLAHGQNPGDTAGVEQHMVGSAGTTQREGSVVQGPGLHAEQNFVAHANLLNTLQAAPARDAPTLRQSQTVLRTV